MDILFFLQAILAVETHYYAPKHYYTPYQLLIYLSSTATIFQFREQESKTKTLTKIAIKKVQEPCFIAHAQMGLWSIMEIEEK